MPDFETLYPGRFLKAKALETPKVIRITGVAATDLEGDDGSKAKCVVKFRAADGDGEIVWCKTNAQIVAEMFHERDFTKWVGRLVTIRNDPTVRFGTETTGGIRVCGSPELKEARDVSIKRPKRKKPEIYRVTPTDKQGRPVASGQPSTGERDPATGERVPGADDMP